MSRFAFVVAGSLACGAAAAPAQPSCAAAAPDGGSGPSLSLGAAARISGPHRAILRSTRAGGPARPLDWTAIAVGTPAGTARGVAVSLAARGGGARSLVLDADEVEPLLAYLEGARAPSGGAGTDATLAFGYFQLRSGPSLIGFPAVPAIRVMFGDVLGLATGGGDPGDVAQIEGRERIAEFRDALRAALAAIPERPPD